MRRRHVLRGIGAALTRCFWITAGTSLASRAARPTCTTPVTDSSRRSAFSSEVNMIRKLPSGGYRLYSRKKDAKTGKRRNLGTFKTRAAAEKHERAVQFFKRH